MLKYSVAALAVAILPLAAMAEPRSISALGHQISIRLSPGGNERLEVDNRVLLSDLHIDIRETGVLSGVAFAVGERNEGGNVCEGSIFVVSMPSQDFARLDGPLDSCEIGNYHVEAEQIVVTTPASGSHDGKRWVWTPAGFSAPSPVKFIPKEGDAWATITQKSISHPSELMEYREFAERLNSVLGAVRPAYLRIADGPGSVKYEGGILVAEACQSHACDSTALLVAIDPMSRQVFLAVKDTDRRKFVVPYATRDWPTVMQNRLRSWQARWPQ
jgi:hypothetical protein